MTSIFTKAGKIGKPVYDKYAKPFLNFNFEMWRKHPVQYASVMSIIPVCYLLIADSDSRYMEAEKLAGPPVC